MTPNSLQFTLTDDQKGRICGILSVGCDRETAANFVGCSITDIGQAMHQDSEFAAHVLRAEAGSELEHVRNIQQAAKDAKNWRASVWWLERHAPERYGSRSAGAVTARQLKQFVKRMVDVLSDEFTNDEAKYRVIARFELEISVLREQLQFAAAGAVSSAIESPAEDGSFISDESAGALDEQEFS